MAGIAILLAILVAVFREEPMLSQRMPDGTVVTIAKVSYGRVHRYRAGRFWERIAARVLPDALKKRLGVGDLRAWTIAFTNATDSTVVFIQSYKSNGFHPGPGSFGPFLSGIVVADDAGNEFRLSATEDAFEGSNMFVDSYQVPLVSRAAQKFHLQLQQARWDADGDTNRFAEFTLKNPASQSAPRWRAPPLPQTNTTENLTVELIELRSFPSEISRASSGRRGFDLSPELQTRARIRLFENGGQTDRWRVAGISVLDEDGNIYEAAVRRTASPGITEFEGGFSEREPRKFQFELARVAPYDPDETATQTNINLSAIPDWPGHRRLDSPITMEFRGFKLQIDDLSQRNDFQQVSLFYTITPPPRGFHHHIILKAVEGNGKETILLELDGGGPEGGTMASKDSKPLITGPYRVDLVFALTKNRTVEFLARPEGGLIKNSK